MTKCKVFSLITTIGIKPLLKKMHCYIRREHLKDELGRINNVLESRNQ